MVDNRGWGCTERGDMGGIKEYKHPAIRPISSGDITYSMEVMINRPVLHNRKLLRE